MPFGAPGRSRRGSRVADAIAFHFPDWHPDAGVCVQCAEIYRTRAEQVRFESAGVGPERLPVAPDRLA